MPKKRYRPEESFAKLREAEVLLGEGKKVPEVVKALGVHESPTTAGARSMAASRSPRRNDSRIWSARTPTAPGGLRSHSQQAHPAGGGRPGNLR